ncbi:ROK family transcriptional regulator [Microbacteriaceae bacterium VKM Ac-2854]|nr:ROK family transcriptional regulator [Microbacteriaceae bacterium VKM Ac-2854]
MSTTRTTPGSQASLREANRARILEAVKKHGGLTQVELAGVTGLSAATVSNIVKELSASGVLTTTPTSRSGRRAQHVTLARSTGLVAGVHFSTRHMRVALADSAHTVLSEYHMPLARDHRADNELDKVARLLADMLDTVEARMDEILAIGLALPAPIDRRTGTITRTGILRGWDNVDVAESLQLRLKRPVYLDNAANLGALAESRMGAMRGYDNAAYISVSHGIGAGLILNGRVFRGNSGSAGEFGHTVIDEEGPVCRCGNRGCLEAIVGADALLAGLRAERPGLKLHDVVVRAVGGDASCIRAIADAGRHIGIAAANLCNLLDPGRLVIGGELARSGELLLGPLRHSLERSVISARGSIPEVLPSQLVDRAELLGAVLYATDRASAAADEAATSGAAPMSGG